MMNGLKAEFWELKNAPAGRRFLACYERHQAREAPWLKPILFFAAIFSLVIGVVLAFIPGPAILFFAIAAALLAAESRVVATAFDAIECWCRRRYEALRGRSKHDARATTKALSPQAVAVIAARAERIKAKQTRRNGKRPSVRGSAELVPPAEPQRDAAEATTEHSDAAARPDATAQHDANAPAATPSDADASGDRQSQRDAVVPPMAAETSTAESTTPGARSTQAYAPNMQTRSRQLPVRGAGTVKLWAGDLPAPQSSKKTTARARRPRKQATKPSIVTLPPPVIIGVEKA